MRLGAPLCACQIQAKKLMNPKQPSFYLQAFTHAFGVVFKPRISMLLSPLIVRFAVVYAVMLGIVSLCFGLTYLLADEAFPPQWLAMLKINLLNLFFVQAILICILTWRMVIDQENKVLAEAKLERQNLRLETEITKSERAVQKQHQTELLYSAILDATPDALLMTNDKGMITLVNQQAENLFGYSANELINQSIGLLIPERFHGKHEKLRNNYGISPVVRPMSVGMSVLALRKDGSEFDVEISLSPIQTARGQFIISTLRDVSQRKAVETELRLAAVAFESQEGMIITDANGVILRVNQAFIETSGYGADEVIGQTPRMFKSGRHDADFYREMWESLNCTGSWQGEIWDRRKNGEIYPKHLTISAVKGNGGASHYVGTHLDITVSKAAAAEIERLAFYDPLTGLPNRRLLVDRLKLALAASKRSERKGALLFIDLDNFKILNDTLGHDMGDMLLQLVAKRLESSVREGDTIARLGGDEFVVMLEDLSDQANEAAVQTEVIGEKILTLLNQPYPLSLHSYHSTPSIGAVLFNEHQQSIEELLKQADIAMYQAKAAGRNALRFFDPQMQTNIIARMALETDLRMALAENQLVLYYQAQVNHSYRIIGAEVLIRWHHPQRGLVSPVDFIPLAEETGLILPIGQWVLETACAQIKRWESSELTSALQLAVNVSARQFYQADFVEQVSSVLHQSAINPERLKLELTESLVLDNINDTILKMNSLREMGVLFSMDDFGTGYSSLSSLKKLPLSQLKIDQSFVRDLSTDPDDVVIVQTIINMASNLGMGVIAEGVETEAQRAFLEQHGCPLFQGYLFSKPVSIDPFEALLKQG